MVIAAVIVIKDYVLATSTNALHEVSHFLFSLRTYEAAIIVITLTSGETEFQRGLLTCVRFQR